MCNVEFQFKVPLPPSLQEEDACSVSEEAQREMKVRLELDAELERLKLVYAEEMGKKLEQERLRQKRFECKHFMEQAIGLTKVGRTLQPLKLPKMFRLDHYVTRPCFRT